MRWAILLGLVGAGIWSETREFLVSHPTESGFGLFAIAAVAYAYDLQARLVGLDGVSLKSATAQARYVEMLKFSPEGEIRNILACTVSYQLLNTSGEVAHSFPLVELVSISPSKATKTIQVQAIDASLRSRPLTSRGLGDLLTQGYEMILHPRQTTNFEYGVCWSNVDMERLARSGRLHVRLTLEIVGQEKIVKLLKLPVTLPMLEKSPQSANPSSSKALPPPPPSLRESSGSSG